MATAVRDGEQAPTAVRDAGAPAVTADTITDEQIREWESGELHRLRGVKGQAANKERWAAVDLATLALAPDDLCFRHIEARWRRYDARARCAEILNARRSA